MSADPTTAAFAAALRARRKLLGLTVEQVAHRLNVERSVVTRLELGYQSPSLARAARYAAAYETTLADLLREPA